MAYTIGSANGKKKAEELKVGESWDNPADGSTWTKKEDGSVSVKHQGVTTDNAYKPTTSTTSGNSQYSSGNSIDYGTLGKQQMAEGADWKTVLNTYNARNNKALTTAGLEKYANDEIQQELWNYIMQQQNNSNSTSDYMQGFNDVYSEEKPTYNAKYDAQMEAMLNKILNREDFSYDAQSDPLYQQYAATYRREGDRAMRDTMAEAAASAGGMNSYAITAAQQANNYYNSQLNDKIPELYQLAYEMYLQDKESQVQDLGLLQSMDATQYNRYRDTMQDYYNDKNFAYGLYSDAVQQGNWDKNFNYNQAINERDFSYNSAQDTITNQWKDKYYNREGLWHNQEIERDDAAIKREEEANEKAEARDLAISMLELGVMPSADVLKVADLSDADAQAILSGVKSQMASRKSSGSSPNSNTKNEKEKDDPELVVTPENEESVNKSLVEKAAKETNSPNLTEDSLLGMLELGWIEYDDKENKFKRTYDFGKSGGGIGFDILNNGIIGL